MNPNDGAATKTAPAATTGLTKPYQLAARDVVAQLQTDPARGLSSDEAQRRLQQYGPNQLQSIPPTPKWRKFLAQFTNPLVLLLLVAVVISLIAWYIEGMHELPYEAIACRGGGSRAAEDDDSHGGRTARWQAAAGGLDGPSARRHPADRRR
jgi:magnesium-transporting ATPase (P-type)